MRTPEEIRRDALELALETKNPHLASSLSTVEILLAVYGIMSEDDKFILSKGHGCAAWYVILRDIGKDPPLNHHPDIDVDNGIECTTGSLGHGLPIAVGMALARKIKNESGLVYILLGDGECQEGTTWESAMLASALRLDNLIVIVDCNDLQALGKTVMLSENNLVTRFRSFGWFAQPAKGHNLQDLTDCLLCSSVDTPMVIVANTTKGKGISYMENCPSFHSRLPSKEEIDIAREDLS